MVIQFKKVVPLLSVLILSACVTENYENDNEKPVVQNQSTNNDIAMTRISLGLGYLNMGKTTQAKLNLEKAKRHAPNLVQVHTAFAHYYEKVGEPELAIAAYEDALKIAPQDADTLNNYGVFLCRQERYQDAEKQMLKAIAVPSYLLVSQSYENLSLCQLKDKRFDDAEVSLEKAILHNPSNANVHLQMVQLHYAKGNYKEAKNALKGYEKATRRFSPDALALAYKVYEKQRQLGTAKNYANMLVKMFPNSYEAKQYILNGLEKIEADNLAKDYRDAMRSSGANNTKKRVVVLSPNRDNPLKKKTTLTATPKPKPKEKKSVPVLKTETPKAAVAQASEPEKTQVKPNLQKTEKRVNSSVETASNTQTKSPKKTIEKQDNPLLAQATARSVSVPMHLVEKGDSLFFISKKYNIQIRALKKWNNFDGSKVLKIGDMIYLDDPKKVSSK